MKFFIAIPTLIFASLATPQVFSSASPDEGGNRAEAAPPGADPLALASELLFRVDSRTDRQNELAFRVFELLVKERRLGEAETLALRMTDHHKGFALARLAVMHQLNGDSEQAREFSDMALAEKELSHGIRRAGEIQAELMALDYIGESGAFDSVRERLDTIRDNRGKVAANAAYVRQVEIEEMEDFLSLVEQMGSKDPVNPATEYDLLAQAVLDRAEEFAQSVEDDDEETKQKVLRLAACGIEVGQQAKFIHPKAILRSVEIASSVGEELEMEIEGRAGPQKMLPIAVAQFMGLGDNNYWKSEMLVRLSVPVTRFDNKKLATELVEEAERVASATREQEQPAAYGWASAGYASIGRQGKASECAEKLVKLASENPNPFNHVLGVVEACLGYHHFDITIPAGMADSFRELIASSSG